MNRTQSENRHNRNRVIKRKKEIVSHYPGGFNCVDGYLDKGKIHCSCKMCKPHKYWKEEAVRYKRDKSNFLEYE